MNDCFFFLIVDFWLNFIVDRSKVCIKYHKKLLDAIFNKRDNGKNSKISYVLCNSYSMACSLIICIRFYCNCMYYFNLWNQMNGLKVDFKIKIVCRQYIYYHNYNDKIKILNMVYIVFITFSNKFVMQRHKRLCGWPQSETTAIDSRKSSWPTPRQAYGNDGK